MEVFCAWNGCRFEEGFWGDGSVDAEILYVECVLDWRGLL